jgi:hypothetical protein
MKATTTYVNSSRMPLCGIFAHVAIAERHVGEVYG